MKHSRTGEGVVEGDSLGDLSKHSSDLRYMEEEERRLIMLVCKKCGGRGHSEEVCTSLFLNFSLPVCKRFGL